MEWQGNPSAPFKHFSLEGMQEQWFCKNCNYTVWIKFGKERLLAYGHSVVPTFEKPFEVQEKEEG